MLLLECVQVKLLADRLRDVLYKWSRTHDTAE